MSDEFAVQAEVVNEAAQEVKPKLTYPRTCKECGTEFAASRINARVCDACKAKPKAKKPRTKIKSMTAEEFKKYTRDKTAKSREKKKKREAKGDSLFLSPTEIKKKEAIAILQEQRLIRNLTCAEVCYELAVVACRNLRLPVNRHVFSHGIATTIAARDLKTELPPPEIVDEWKPGERLREHELYALWDYSTAWRTQSDGTRLTFEQWKEYRRKSITDVVWFGNTVLEKQFEPEPHGRWATELFPNLEPALLSLPEKFGQRDVAKAFRAMSDVRVRCLISARSSFKSTFSTVWTLAVMLCFAGSIRILICTSTQPLAKAFAKAFRSYLTVRDPNNPTLLNQLFPEHCVAPDEGKTLEYTSPFRQLDMLVEPTLAATSVISEGQAGGRYDLAVMDDCAEISNSNNVEQRAKTQERLDMLRELAEPHALTNYIGTPISPGMGTPEDPGDIYSVLLRREEANRKNGGAPKLLYQICPGWTVKEGVGKKAWDTTLEEHEVDLLFPGRLTFKYLMDKLREEYATDTSCRIFRQQSLVTWVPDAEEGLRCTFTEQDLRARFRNPFFFTSVPLRSVASLDRAYSKSRYADFSCLVAGNIQPVEGKDALVINDVHMDRWKESELAEAMCAFFQKHGTTYFIVEKDKGWQELWEKCKEIAQSARYSSTLILPYFDWIVVDSSAHAFAKRAKKLELPLSDGRLWFHTSLTCGMDALMKQFTDFDGITPSNSTRKDDAVAAVSLLWNRCGPRTMQETTTITEEEKKEQEMRLDEETKRARRAQLYNQMFGEPNNYGNVHKASEFSNKPLDQQPKPQPVVDTAPSNPMAEHLRRVTPNFPQGRLFKFGRRGSG